MYTEIRFTLNGEQKLYQGDPLRRLLDVLREDYGLTGSKRASAEPAPSSKTASWSRAASSPSARSTAASF